MLWGYLVSDLLLVGCCAPIYQLYVFKHIFKLIFQFHYAEIFWRRTKRMAGKEDGPRKVVCWES